MSSSFIFQNYYQLFISDILKMFQIMLKMTMTTMTMTTKAALAKELPRLPWPRNCQGSLGVSLAKAAFVVIVIFNII